MNKLRPPMTKPRLPLDRGWAWLVMIGTFINVLVAISFIRSLAIILPVFLDKYQQSVAMTTLAFGIGEMSESVGNIILPIVFLPRFSPRTLCFCAGLATSGAIMALGFAENVALLNVLFGCIGFARCFLMNLPLYVLGCYFKKRLSFASACASMGLSMATMLVPLATRHLLDAYALKWTFLLIGAFSLHSAVGALLFRPTSKYRDEDVKSLDEGKDKGSEESHESTRENGKEENTCLAPHNGNARSIEESKDRKDVEEIFLSSHSELSNSSSGHLEQTKGKESETYFSSSAASDHHNILSLATQCDSLTATHTDTTLSDCDCILQQRDKQPCQRQNQSSQNHTYHHASLPSRERLNTACASEKSFSVHQQRTKSDIEDDEFLLEEKGSGDTMTQISTTTSESETKIRGKDKTSAAIRLRRWWKQTMADSTYTNPVALIIIVSTGLGVQTQAGSVYLPVLGLENGLTKDQVPWLLTITGASDIAGKLIIGLLADHGCLSPIYIVCLTQTTAGVALMMAPLYRSMAAMSVLCVTFGLTAGIIHIMIPTLVTRLVGLPSLPRVVSAYFLLSCVVTFVMHVVVGSIKDHTNSFAGGFQFVACLLLISAAVLLLVRPVRRRRKNGERQREEEEEEE